MPKSNRIINPMDLWSFLKLDDILKDNSHCNVIQHTVFAFNGGEEHIKIHPETVKNPFVLIECNIQNSGDLIRLLLATDALKRIGVDNISLCMPYIPFARQDRVMVEGEPLSIKVFADIINSQNYDTVYVLDPHSDVSTALIKNISLINVDSEIDKIIKSHKNPVLIAPDAGSLKKIFKIAQRNNVEVVCFNKNRDINDGKITGFSINDPVKLTHYSNAIIIDDICDGGKTFLGISEIMKGYIDIYVSLIVSHGIFSKGFDIFNGLIDEIFCFNLMGGDRTDRVIKIPILISDL